MTTLRQAAQAVVERWDAPAWSDLPSTGTHIAALRKALEAPEQEPDTYSKVVPDAYSKGVRDGYAGNSLILDSVTKERDECRAAADKMAAAHKIERDALLAKIDLANRKFAVLNNENAFENLYQAGIAQEREITKLTTERDALTLANKDLSDWFDALKADHDKLTAAAKTAGSKLPALFSQVEWLGNEVRVHIFERRADQTPFNLHSSTHPAPPPAAPQPPQGDKP